MAPVAMDETPRKTTTGATRQMPTVFFEVGFVKNKLKVHLAARSYTFCLVPRKQSRPQKSKQKKGGGGKNVELLPGKLEKRSGPSGFGG